MLSSFRLKIDLKRYADWPIEIRQLKVRRNPLLEALTLQQYLRSLEFAGNPLLFDLKSAFYAGAAYPGTFYLHLTDPPSLLPADLTKYSRPARKILGTSSKTLSPVARARAYAAYGLTKRGVNRAAKIIVMTEKIQREVHALYGAASMVVRPGVSTGKLQTQHVSSRIKILSVSRLEVSKRVEWVLRALATLNEQETFKQLPWVFQVIGEGPAHESLRRLAIDLGLSERTEFLGHVSDDELQRAYATASLFVMPAVQGYGLPALEALERRIPTIVHRDSGVSEILNETPWVEIIEGQNGQLEAAIKSMIERLLKEQLSTVSLPKIPSSTEWAESIACACGWLA